MGELRQLADLGDDDESPSNAGSSKPNAVADDAPRPAPATSASTSTPAPAIKLAASPASDQDAGVGDDGDHGDEDDEGDDEEDVPGAPRATANQRRRLLGYLTIMGILVVYSLIAFWPRPTPNEQVPPKSDSTRQNQNMPQPRRDSAAGRGQPARPASGKPVRLSGPVPNSGVLPVRLEGSLALQTPPAPARRDTSTCGWRAWTVDQVLWADTSRASRTLDTLRNQMIAVCYFGRPLVVWKEVQLLVLVLLGGVLGGVLHALRRVTRLEFQNKLYEYGLAGFYTWPVTGALVAVVFYAIIRGGFFSPQASVAQTSTYSFIALALLAGMFPHEAIAKLKQIAETTLTKSSTTPGKPVKTSGNGAGSDKAGGAAPAARPANERGDLPNEAGAPGEAQG